MSNLKDVVETVSEVVDTTVVRLETMSLTQQLAAFMNATIVVATHGQALAHAMFMPYNSVLVLLMEPGGYVAPCVMLYFAFTFEWAHCPTLVRSLLSGMAGSGCTRTWHSSAVSMSWSCATLVAASTPRAGVALPTTRK